MQRQERVCEVLITVTVVLVCSVSHSNCRLIFRKNETQIERRLLLSGKLSTGMS